MKSLWSFEPFHQNTNSIKSMYKSLSLLTGNPANIEVGFVVTHTEAELNLAFDIPEHERYSTYPKEQIKKVLKGAQISIDDKKIHLVDYSTYSNTKSVDKLLKLATDRNVDLIGLYTKARQGFVQFALGSFAETLIHRSKKDLLILSPNTKVSAQIKNILFASDFGPNSKNEILKLLNYVKNLDSKLTVLHHAEVIYKWSLDEKSTQVRAYRKKVDQMKNWIEDQCKKSGISVNVIIVSDFSSTSDHIFALLKKNKIDLIAVAAKVGPLAALMGGSVTRQIIRKSPLPVLVLKNGSKK